MRKGNEEKMEHDFNKVFDVESDYWKKVVEIFEANEHFPKKVVENRNLHHKYPRSFSKKHKEPIDNDDDNLISLSISDHFLVHYYYWKCARKGYRTSMAFAFRLMAKKAFTIISDETVLSLARDLDGVELKHSRATRKKISKALTGRHLSDETRKKVAKAATGNRNCVGKKTALGIHHSTESKKACAISHGGQLIQCIETKEIHYRFEWVFLGFRHASEVAKSKRKSDKGFHFKIAS